MGKTTDINQTTPSLVSLRPLINERRNSTLMTRHFPDLDSVSDRLKQISHAVRSIRHTIHTQTHSCARFSDVISWGNQWWRRPRYKYHQKSPKYVSGNSRFFSKYLKNIWLHVVNITVKTQQYSLSSKMATQISVNFGKLHSCTAYNKTKTISHKVNLIYSALQPPRRLGHCTLIQAEFVNDHEVLEV